MLEYRRVHWSLDCRLAETLGFGHECRNARGEIFVVQPGGGKPFDQQTVFSQYENRVNSWALPKRARKISDVGH
jgi:hypothetical protein